jgi:hypothetical protein
MRAKLYVIPARKPVRKFSSGRLPKIWRKAKAEFKALFVAIGMSLVSAYTAWQTQENALSQISTLQGMRYSQFLSNLSNAIDQDIPVPSSGVPSSGTATTSTSGGLTAMLTNPFDFGHNSKTLSPTVMENWQNNWTITPISDPQDLQNLRALTGLLLLPEQNISKYIANTLAVWQLNENDRNTLQGCGIDWAFDGNGRPK